MKYRIIKKDNSTTFDYEKKLNILLQNNEFIYDSAAKFVIVLGGDGALLRAIHENLEQECTFYIVNFGTLGYHTTIENGEIEEVVSSIVNFKYELDEYFISEVIINGEKEYFVNEVIFNSYKFLQNSTVRYDDNVYKVNASKLVVASKFGSSGFIWYNGLVNVDLDLNYFQIGCVGSINNKILSSLDRNVIVSDNKVVSGVVNNVNYVNIDFKVIEYNGIIEYKVSKSKFKYCICR